MEEDYTVYLCLDRNTDTPRNKHPKELYSRRVRAYRDASVVTMDLSFERLDQSGCAEYLDTDDSFFFEGAHIYRSRRFRKEILRGSC